MIENIDTIVFDYGSVVVDIDNRKIVQSLCSLGVSRFKQVLYFFTIKRLMRQYIDGIIPLPKTLEEMRRICRRGTTTQDIMNVLDKLSGDLPRHRLEHIIALKKRYKVYVLSNINDFLWRKSAQQIVNLGHQPEECFDGLFMSYEMGVAKPNRDIYQRMIDATRMNPERALYFDDRRNNYEAGKKAGFRAVLVKPNHLEDTDEWKELIR